MYQVTCSGVAASTKGNNALMRKEMPFGDRDNRGLSSFKSPCARFMAIVRKNQGKYTRPPTGT